MNNCELPKEIYLNWKINTEKNIEKTNNLKKEISIEIPKLSVGLKDSIFSIEKLAIRRRCIGHLYALERVNGFNNNRMIVEKIIWPIIENYHYSSDVRRMLDRVMEDFPAIQIDYNRKDNIFTFATKDGVFHISDVANYLANNYDEDSRSLPGQCNCFASSAFLKLQNNMDRVINITDGRFHGDGYIHCYNYDPKTDFIVDNATNLAMLRKDYLNLLQRDFNNPMCFDAFANNRKMIDDFTKENSAAVQKVLTK